MKNTLKTTVLLAGLGGLLIFAGQQIFGGGGAVIGLALGLLIVGGSYWFSDKLAIRSAGAVEASEAEMPQYFATMRDLSERAGIPMPRLYVSPNMQPNAFATGRNPSHAAVCVTQGLLQALTWDEIKGVLAHELCHVKHRDILIGSVAAAIAMGITFVARMAMWGAIFGGGRDDDRNPIAELALILLAPVAAMLIQMAVSRSREFEADRGGARLLGDGEPLASALEKLEVYSQRIPMDVDPAQAQAYIVNPLKGSKASFANMFRTHPTTEARIARLRGREWAAA